MKKRSAAIIAGIFGFPIACLVLFAPFRAIAGALVLFAFMAVSMSGQNGPIRIVLDVVPPSPGETCLVSWDAYVARAMSFDSKREHGSSRDASGQVVIESRRCRSLTVFVGHEGYFPVNLSYSHTTPSAGMRLESGVQVYHETVKLERIPSTVGKLSACGFLLETRNQEPMETATLYVHANPRSRSSVRMTPKQFRDTTSTPSAVLVAEMLEEPVAATGEGVDTSRTLTGTRSLPKVWIVWKDCEGGFVLADAPEKRNERDDLQYLFEAPAEGYESRFEVPAAFLAKHELSRKGCPYFYCRVGALYGRGVITSASRRGDGGITVSGDIEFQEDGSRLFAVKD